MILNNNQTPALAKEIKKKYHRFLHQAIPRHHYSPETLLMINYFKKNLHCLFNQYIESFRQSSSKGIFR